MSLENVKYFWADLPKWAKGVVVVAGIAIPSYVGYTIYKNAKDAKDRDEANKKLLVTKNDLDNLIKQGIKPSYDETEYNSMADILFTAMNGYGTDTIKIYGVMSQMKNDADIRALILAYNKRTLSTGTGNPTKDVEQTLPSALADELGTEYGGQAVQLNEATKKCWSKLKSWLMAEELAMVNCILKSNGVSFQFS